MDIFAWAAVALVAGPILAALAIPVFKWLFADSTRLLIVLALFAAVWYLRGLTSIVDSWSFNAPVTAL